MFELKLTYGTTRTSVTANVNDTIAKAIRDNDLSTQGAMVAFNGHILDLSELDKTFNELGVRAGDTGSLAVTVKATSAH